VGDNLTIRIRYLGAFADVAKSKEETIEFPDDGHVGSLVDKMLERNNEEFRRLMIDPSTDILRGGVTLLVNGHKRNMDYGLCDGDEVALLTPVAGG